MYYRIYRPKTIAELDNSSVKQVLTHILQTASLPHAFLYVGSKGTGKTSSARIFAKAINCLNNKYTGKGDSIEPCNTCSNCKSIDTGSSPDVLELDAASNRGIDEIRSLIRESAFLPISNRYRVYIIDEAHMITHDAFNALLKTLEEPPKSVIFILATTNREKIPQTIASRCQIISFGKAKKIDIVSQLKRIALAEKLKVDDEFLSLIAHYSDQSFRDAAKLFEELVIQDKLTIEKAKEYLKVGSKEGLIAILEKKSDKEALSWTNEFVQNGGSVKMLIEELLETLRRALLEKKGVTQEEPVALTLTVSEISQLMKSLTEAYTLLRSTPIESIPLEIALVEFYNYRNKITN